ncbi:MAG: sterol desaturase family protein [Alphaproteobacteria bacterium]
MNLIIEHESSLRLAVFIGLLTVMFTWESVTPARRFEVSKKTRWSANIGLVLIDTAVLRLLVPILAVGIASREWGLMNWISTPVWVSGIVGYIALELLVYWQHRFFHTVPFLWRFHRVHHCDTGFDSTTGLRFHPVESIISMLSKVAVVATLGIPVISVFIFEIILSGTAIFNHANIRLPVKFESWVRKLIVTPDHHRIHHSSAENETNSNFAFSIVIWDHLFDTYQYSPAKGQNNMQIGLEGLRSSQEQRLDKLLLQPLKK